MPEIEILLTDSSNADFKKLTDELGKELHKPDGPPADTNAEISETDNLTTVLVVYVNNSPVACGGFRQYNSSSVEIKRIYVMPSHRRKKLALQVLSGLELLAKELKYKFCILKAGKDQPEAISFFTNNDYKKVENLGIYINDTNSICFRKEFKLC